MPDVSHGTVVVSYGSHGVVRLADRRSVNCKYRRQVGRPFCGDHVTVTQADAHSWVVRSIEERQNRFVRADPQGRQVTVAANLDRVLVVIAPKPAPSRDLLERYLVAVHSLGIEPVIVVNKAELLQTGAGCEDTGPPFSRMGAYANLGYETVRTSCKTAPGVDALRALLVDGTSILVGQSGVGKSSLVNRLIPDLDLQTGALSLATGKGIHTTTATTLYELSGGGELIDSPGVWEYGIWKLENHELTQGFPEFHDYTGHCHFHNCRHDSEPGCAVKQAVADGLVHPWRYEAYVRLLQQN